MYRPSRVLVINPGSMSTALSLFSGEDESRAARLPAPEGTPRVLDQFPVRLAAIEAEVAAWGVRPGALSAVVGRGGMLRPVCGGTYHVNDAMVEEMLAPGEREHASNLGAPLARAVARRYTVASDGEVPSFVVDPVSVDEFEPLARVSGLPAIERRSLSHALNLKAVARRAATDLGATYEAVNLVVAHLGSGISVSAHRRGRMIDANQALDGTGPFSPERAGGLPIGDVLRMAYAGNESYTAMFRRLTRRAGLYAHLGTNDAIEVERRIAVGDEHAALIYEAMAYQIAKEIGLMATVLHGDVQAVVLTGALAHSDLLCGWVQARTEWIAPFRRYPGQMEMLAMALGVLRVLRGQEQAKEYKPRD